MSTAIITILLYVHLIFIYALYKKRNDIIDVMWGPGIFIASAVYVFNQEFSWNSFLAIILVFIWSIRIFLHIYTRFKSKEIEDSRYAKWRLEWKYFKLRSYFQIFLLQGILMLFMGSIFHYSSSINNYYTLILGAIVAIFGLTFEAVADYQLKQFLKLGNGKIMTSGLWSLSRHPNYFGEVTFWWGIFIMFSHNLIHNLSFGILLTPITITFLILKVSGIPMLEAKYRGNRSWTIYKNKTPAFFPKLPKF